MFELELPRLCALPHVEQVAQLALKHRQNKNQRQRIVIFVGSPIAADEARRSPCLRLLSASFRTHLD